MQKTWEEQTYHSSDDEESVNVGVGLRLRFLEEPSSIVAIASLSALLLRVLEYEEVDATAIGGGEVETFSDPFVLAELSYERIFSTYSHNNPNKKSPRRTK